MAVDENTKTPAIYTFELAPWPAPNPETLRFICESEEEAWTALLADQPTLGALFTLVKTEPLTENQVAIAEIFERLLRSVSTTPLTLEQVGDALARWLSTKPPTPKQVDQCTQEIYELAMQALLGKVEPLM